MHSRSPKLKFAADAADGAVDAAAVAGAPSKRRQCGVMVFHFCFKLLLASATEFEITAKNGEW